MESDYLRRWIGEPITEALTEAALKRPSDPIEYIALWLLKYKENQDQIRVVRTFIFLVLSLFFFHV